MAEVAAVNCKSHRDAASKTLEEEKATDQKLTTMVEAQVNRKAA
jgi:ferritin-like metal-binding protein YciE